ncbi:hypothetical protein HXX76_013934 [Chlamydomonas incerta]|uniref:Uncharacterized protein n=1 Tax=Chlamydomonas incerta TaxID=51695 RepID=A0A835SRB3_CHLIN|nr:hypothetical protein HXX76_013934 [Chlamydomonas incerta]|eukprot:KAG2425180.1 hypothetical protein HXX76_013934 [Chlamydomonas incerta]
MATAISHIGAALAFRHHPTLGGFLAHEAACAAAEIGGALCYRAVTKHNKTGGRARHVAGIVAVMLTARVLAGLGYTALARYFRGPVVYPRPPAEAGNADDVVVERVE